MSKRQIISPISIDLGAKNTGVYFAHYEAGSPIQDIEKEGKVYQLERDNFTLMMTNRTAKRHQRRGYKRRRMVKRLFRLIWRNEFGLEWDDQIQQSIGFLFNRRGFSFLTEEYDANVLNLFPVEAFEELPITLQNEIGNPQNLTKSLLEWGKSGLSHVESMFELINEKPKSIKRKLLLISRTEMLRRCCETKISDEKIKENRDNKNIADWILEAWDDMGIAILKHIQEDQKPINLAAILNMQTDSSVVDEIRNSIPPDFDQEKDTLKSSVWNFDATKSELESASFERPETSNNSARVKWLRSHIQHFAFALHKLCEELSSGARHRSKYFEEIKSVLDSRSHSNDYLNTFCTKLQSGQFIIEKDTPLTPQSLANLIGHLSNLELKPLRKYFSDKRHAQEDFWDRERLNKVIHKWILSDWRVNSEKDHDKGRGNEWEYQKLRRKLIAHEGSVIEFFLQESPLFTIPPYQDNNNRRPPKCQSLILNKNNLDANYSNWRKWLYELLTIPSVKEYLGNYDTNMKNLKSGKDIAYFIDETINSSKKSNSRCRTTKDLDARVLQFLLDRVKDEDVLKLNEIYSHTKKIRQQQSTPIEREKARDKLMEAIDSSQLPEKLKSSPNHQDGSVFVQGGFLHLVCKYYKIRQNARDGRIFIHPEYRYSRGRGFENAGRFEDHDHLLTYCNHKPRQKRYQIFSDVASLFQLSPQQLKNKTKSESDADLRIWLEKFKGLKSNCTKAAKAQKVHRGRMKETILKTGNSGNARDELSKLVKRSKDLCIEIGNCFYDDESRRERWNQTLREHPARAVFLLAQINNVVFQERRGNANTCSICSFDNTERMQLFNEHVRAQRLPSIPTRLIDGSVMRLARIVGGAIANDKWKRIHTDLAEGNQVRIPIITESNRFEFEPNLESLKGRSNNSIGSNANLSKLKKDRIKGSVPCSPYSGDEIGNSGDLDHIIPRHHPRWGTLNDEANMIYTSKRDNRDEKGNSEYSLANLHKNYKEQVFGTTCDLQITEHIKDVIGDGLDGQFKFGRYFNFLDLTNEQQTAFRHALFLIDDPLRQLVLNAINHRTKTLVNGTQRYFAEVLANSLYKKAKKINKHHLLSFDYFGVEAQENSRGDGVFNLRHDLVTYYRPDLKAYNKIEESPQHPYSHLLDSQIAFCMIAAAHRDSGGLRLNLGNAGIWSRVDRLTASEGTNVPNINDDSLFTAIEVDPKNFQKNVISLKRRKPDHRYFDHRSIHRDGMYAEHYLPILVHCKTSKVRIGFNWTNSFELRDSKANRKKLYFVFQFNQKTKSLALHEDDSFVGLKSQLIQIGFKSNKNYFHISLNLQLVHSYCIENYNTAKGCQTYSDGMKFLREKLSYRTEKKQIETLDDAKKILNTAKKFQLSREQSNLILPVKCEWSRLVDKWAKSQNKDDSKFLKDYFNTRDRQTHQRHRQVYSLPIKSDQGHILIKRNSWNNKPIYQIVNDSDSRKIDAKAFTPVCNRNGEIGKLLSESANSRNIYLLNSTKYYSELSRDVKIIEPERWYEVELKDSLKKIGISVLKYRIDNNSRPRVRIEFNKPPKEKKIDKLFNEPLLKPKPEEKEKVKQELRNKLKRGEESLFVEYTGAGFSSQIKSLLTKALQQEYFPEIGAGVANPMS